MVVINAQQYVCHWCGAPQARKCTCGYYTCDNCHGFPNEQGCTHTKYEPVVSDGWVIDDSNTV